MSKTLYVQTRFVTLHETSPSDFIPGGGPALKIAGYSILKSKYSYELGNDPNPGGDLDFSEFGISGASFNKPVNFNEVETYATETGTRSHKVWWSVTVPDSFQIPPEITTPITAYLLDQTKDAAIEWMDNNGFSAAANYLESIWDSASTAYDLHDIQKDYLQDQFQAMNDVLDGKISASEFDQVTSQNAIGLEGQLLNLAGVPEPIAQGIAQGFAHVALARDYVGPNDGRAGFLDPVTHEFTSSEFHVLESNLPGGGVSYEGTSSRQSFIGTTQDDVAALREGADTADGGKGDDWLRGGDGGDTLLGGDGNDALQGDNDNDLLYGGRGNDNLQGGAGNDQFSGGTGSDSFLGGSGTDTIRYDVFDPDLLAVTETYTVNLLTKKGGGYAAGDTYDSIENVVGGFNNDALTGNDSANTLSGLAGIDTLRGNGGNDTLVGGDGNDMLVGDAGNDVLRGEGGNDRLTGGLGADVLYGGTGRDIFDYNAIKESSAASGRDTLKDFRHSQGDDIDLSTIDAKTTAGGNNAFKFIGAEDFHKKAGELHYVKKSGYVMVEGDVNGDGKADLQIKVDDVSKLYSNDFVL